MRCVLAEFKNTESVAENQVEQQNKQANQARREERYRITNNWPKIRRRKNSRNEIHSKKVRKT